MDPGPRTRRPPTTTSPRGCRRTEMGLEPTLVCAISSPAGVGCGILATLKGAPCILVPLHVVGGPENAHRVRIAAEVGGKVTRLRLRPPPSEGWRLSSPEPPRGRAPDVNRMDYVIAPCELPATIDARTLTALDACDPPSVVPRGEERTRRVEIVAAPASWLRARRPRVRRTTTTNGRSTGTDETSPASGRRGTRTSGRLEPDRGRRRDLTHLGRLAATALRRSLCGTTLARRRVRAERRCSRRATTGRREGSSRCTGRAIPPRRYRRSAARRGIEHRRYHEGRAEITAERAVRTGASAGHLRAAASELLLRPAARATGTSRAVVAVAPPPPRCARRPNTRIARRGRRVIFPAAAATFTRERTPCSPRSKNGRSCPRRGPFDSQTPPRIWLVHSLERSSRSLALRNRRTPAGRAVEARRRLKPSSPRLFGH